MKHKPTYDKPIIRIANLPLDAIFHVHVTNFRKVIMKFHLLIFFGMNIGYNNLI